MKSVAAKPVAGRNGSTGVALVLLVLFATLGLAPAARAGHASSQPSAQGREVDFTLKDLNGRTVHLKDLRGHPLIIDFWATWCPPCRKQLPELKKIYQRYRSRGLMVLGVACDSIKGDGPEAVTEFVREYKLDYPILIGTDEVVDGFDVQGIPATFFVTRQGRVLARMDGAGANGELSDATKNLLAADRRASN